MEPTIKLAKDLKSVYLPNIDDYQFWTKYPPLTFVQKVTLSLPVTSGTCSGTFSYTHNYNFKIMTLAQLTPPGGLNKYLLPWRNDFNPGKGGTCDALHPFLSESFSYKIKDNTIDIIYDVKCYQTMGGQACPGVTRTYTVDLYFFLFNLGRK